MIFKINARGKNEISKHYRIIYGETKEEITDTEILNDIKLILKTIVKTIEYIEENIDDENNKKENLIFDLTYTNNKSEGLASVIEEILHELGYKFYLREVEKKEEIVNL